MFPNDECGGPSRRNLAIISALSLTNILHASMSRRFSIYPYATNIIIWYLATRSSIMVR